MGILLSIANKKQSRGEMIIYEKAFLSSKTGIENDFRGKTENRKVTIVSKEAWDKVCKDLGKKISWTARRANLLIEGIELQNSTGKKLRIGNEVELEIMGETKPCERMNEECDGLLNAMKQEWRGGVICKVLKEGNISIGNEVKVVSL